MAQDPPQLVAGRYHLVEVIGRGGMGAVWRARDETLGRDVAVKELVLPPVADEADRAAFCARTIREARSAARLKHPGIVTIHDVIQQDGLPWIIMEFVTGRSLAKLIESAGRLPPVQVARIGLRILDALRAAHAVGIVHRDVKPANVLLEAGSPVGRAGGAGHAADGRGPGQGQGRDESEGDGDGVRERVVLTDFGIAALEGDAAITQSGLILGTPAFMAPEQARGLRATERSDLWSLGATLYAAVEGGPPFRGPSSGAVFMALAADEPRPAVHAGPLAPVLHGLLRKDPAQRLSAGQTAALLRQIADGAARPRPADQPAAPRTMPRPDPPGTEDPGPPQDIGWPRETAPPQPAGAAPHGAPPHQPAAPPLPPPSAPSPQQLFDSFLSTLAGPPGSPTWTQIPQLWWAEIWRRPWTPIWRFPPGERLRRAAVLSPFTLLYPPLGFVCGLLIVIMMHRRGDHGWQFRVALVPVLAGALVVALLVLGYFASLVNPAA